MVCLWFQIQSDTSRCMTTNTFGISRDIPKGKMWLGDSTGEIEIMSVMSLNCVVLSSLWFLLCRTVLGSYGLIHSWWVKCCSIDSFPLSLRHVLLCCRVVALSMSPVDDTFISGSLDKTIRLWDLRSPNCQVQYQIHVPTLCVVFSVRRMQNGCMLVRIQNYCCWCIVNTFPECWRSLDQKKLPLKSLNMSHCVTPITSTYVSVLERHWEEQEVTPTADEMRRSGYYQLVNQAVSLMGWER